MKKFLRPACLLIFGLWLSTSIFSQKMDFDVLAGTDYSKYKTYKWQRAPDAVYPGTADDQMLIRTIDEQLSLKGLTKTDSDDPDLYVIYQLAIVDNMKWSSFRTDVGWSGNPVSDMYSTISGATTNSNYPVSAGSLFIDLYDVTQKKRVWQVHAVKSVNPAGEAKKKEKNARKVMEKIFRNYPTPLPKK